MDVGVADRRLLRQLGGAPASGETDVGAQFGPDGIPMFVHTPGKHLRVVVAGESPAPETGQELICLTHRG